jgi:hypothetical protein
MEIRLFKTISGGFAWILFILCLMAISLLIQSCNDKEQKPAGILSHDQMVNVLAEIYIAEEKVNKLNIPRDSSELIFRLLEGKVFEKTGVSDSVFAASLDYYVDRPQEIELIYSALVDSLQLKEQRASSRKQAQ